MRWKEIVSETASAGASAAGNIATSVGGIGAGFDPNGHKGIYDSQEKRKKRTKKKNESTEVVVIRR